MHLAAASLASPCQSRPAVPDLLLIDELGQAVLLQLPNKLHKHLFEICKKKKKKKKKFFFFKQI